MQSFKLYTIKAQSFEAGIALQKYGAASSQNEISSLGSIAMYPLYPQKLQQSRAQQMLPLSLSYVLQANNAAVSKQGVILQISANQWLPLSAAKDHSLILDVFDNHILLYCPVGGTFLRSCSKKNPLLLQIGKNGEPVITKQNNINLEITALGPGMITPTFNSEAAEVLEKKLRRKAVAKRPKSAPMEAALGKAAQ